MIYLIGLAWCAAFYLPVNLNLTQSLFIPCVPYAILAALHAKRCKRILAVMQITGISIVYLLANVFLVKSFTTDASARLLSGVQLPYSLFCAFLVGLSQPYSVKEKLVVSRVILGFATFFCLYGIAEITNPMFANVSDTFRSWCYSFEQLYGTNSSHLVRDLIISGHERPKAFASEPSAAAWGIMCLCISGYALTSSVRERVFVLCIVLVSTIVFSSPSNLVGFCLLAFCSLIENRRVSMRALWFYIIGSLTFSWLAYLMALTFLDGRILLITSYEDRSTYVRLIQPFEMAFLGLKFDALFGVGFGGLEEIWNLIEILEVDAVSSRINLTAGAALLTVPLFGGITGVLLLSVLGIAIYREIAVTQRLAFISVVLFAMMNKSSIVITVAWLVVSIWIVAHPNCVTERSVHR
jgi:hypothetical protein